MLLRVSHRKRSTLLSTIVLHKKTIILDTNILVSAFIKSQSPAADGLTLALTHFDVVYSQETIFELADVMSRPFTELYIAKDISRALVFDFAESGRQISVTTSITDCRDPRDDKFLALAIDAHALLIVSGDDDLLTLHPYGQIAILDLRTFLDTYTDYL
jgi:uncharacterized protein